MEFTTPGADGAIATTDTGGSGGSAAGGGGAGGGGGAVDLDERVHMALAFAEEQLVAAVKEVGDPTRYPQSAGDSGPWATTDRTEWTSGFFPGCLWLMHEHTGRDDFRTWAEQWTQNLEAQKDWTGGHDVGIQILSSFGQGLRIANVEGYRGVVMAAATSLDSRYDPEIGCFRSWDWGLWSFPVTSGSMISIDLLFRAQAMGGPASLRVHALSHAHRMMAEHIRPVGSTYRIVDFDPDTGDVRWKGNLPRLDDEATWSRGMAYKFYGFTRAARRTGNSVLLATAERLASWFIDHLPLDHVPVWAFEVPGPVEQPRDTVAAAVAASALLELAQSASTADKRAEYRNAAHAILLSLTSPDYLAAGTESSAILLQGLHNDRSQSVIAGDYYFIEALLRYLEDSSQP
jgi:unsaturated chondroitin disaccharide hydrolase